MNATVTSNKYETMSTALLVNDFAQEPCNISQIIPRETEGYSFGLVGLSDQRYLRHMEAHERSV